MGPWAPASMDSGIPDVPGTRIHGVPGLGIPGRARIIDLSGAGEGALKTKVLDPANMVAEIGGS